MKLFPKKETDSKGFTMLEVIAILIILGIVAAVAISRVGSSQNDLIVQADTVKTHLRFTQLKALSDDVNDDGTAASWGIVFTANSYTLYKNGAAATINLPGEDSSSHTFPTGVTVGSTTVNFDSWGSPGTAGVMVTLTQDGVSKPITINAYTGYIP